MFKLLFIFFCISCFYHTGVTQVLLIAVDSDRVQFPH